MVNYIIQSFRQVSGLYSSQSWARIIALSLVMVAAFTMNPYVAVADGVSDIANNVVESVAKLPTLIAALSYLAGIFFGVSGILKVKSHVEQPNQNQLNAAWGRFLIGGALISLPIVYEAMAVAITSGAENRFEDQDRFNAVNALSGFSGKISDLFGGAGITLDFNALLNAVRDSISRLPSFITTVAFLTGLVLGVSGLFKLKEHIEDPDRNPMKEAITRFIIGGMLFGLPTIYTVLAATFSFGDGGADFLQKLGSLLDVGGILKSEYSLDRDCVAALASSPLDGVTDAVNNVAGALGGEGSNHTKDANLGDAICKSYSHMLTFPAFLKLLSKLFGFYFGYIAVLKLRDHLVNPQNNPLSQSLARFAAGGAFLSMDSIVVAVKQTVTPQSSEVVSGIGAVGKIVNGIAGKGKHGYNTEAKCDADTVGGLLGGIGDLLGGVSTGGGTSGTTSEKFGDQIYCIVTDFAGPLHTAISFFALVAGMILLMVGISRFLKSEQDGPKAPNGLGTLFTFITAGVLLSFNDFIKLINTTVFGGAKAQTSAKFSDASIIGQALDEVAEKQFYSTLSAVLKFMVVIGLISFARGIFIIRSSTEGNNQASIMAGVTHIIGGALAINLGGFLNLIQNTFGLSDMGLIFS